MTIQMDLLLWRHADAADGTPDATRQLTMKGMRQAERMATWLDDHAPRDLRVLVSPATRTQQTASAWTRNYETCEELAIGREASEALAAAGWPDTEGAVLLVGHQPMLGRIASLLLRGEEEDISFKKGALWWFQLREREGEQQIVLKTVMSADML